MLENQTMKTKMMMYMPRMTKILPPPKKQIQLLPRRAIAQGIRLAPGKGREETQQIQGQVVILHQPWRMTTKSLID